MKKKGLSMNLIMALTLTAVAVSVLLCANLVFMQTYRRTLLRNAETTSRQAIAQASSTMNEYLEDMNDAVTLLTGYLELPAEEREARFEAFLEIRADVVAVTTYDAEGECATATALAAVCGKIFCKTSPLTRTSGSFTRRASFPRPT